ncbi:MAG: hypothetical protein WC619_01340 [Patescibacteria group bacterium]
MKNFLLGVLTTAVIFVAVVILFPDVLRTSSDQDMYVDEVGGVWLPVETAQGEKKVFVFANGKSFEYIGAKKPDVAFTAVIKVKDGGLSIESFKEGEGLTPVEELSPRPDPSKLVMLQ